MFIRKCSIQLIRDLSGITIKFFRRLRLKAFFHNQDHQTDGPANDPGAASDDRERDEPSSTPDDNQIFERLKPKQSTWIPPSDQFSSLDHYIYRCRTEINRLDFSKQATARNLLKEERVALTSLRNRTDIVIKPADKGGAVVVWDRNLYLDEATKQLSDTQFYQQIDRDVTETHQKEIISVVTQATTSGRFAY